MVGRFVCWRRGACCPARANGVIALAALARRHRHTLCGANHRSIEGAAPLGNADGIAGATQKAGTLGPCAAQSTVPVLSPTTWGGRTLRYDFAIAAADEGTQAAHKQAATIATMAFMALATAWKWLREGLLFQVILNEIRLEAFSFFFIRERRELDTGPRQGPRGYDLVRPPALLHAHINTSPPLLLNRRTPRCPRSCRAPRCSPCGSPPGPCSVSGRPAS